MTRTYSKPLLLAIIFVCILSCLNMVSCSSSNPGTLEATVKFSVPQTISSESLNTFNNIIYVDVIFSSKLPKDITLAFDWAGTSTTFLNGDFTKGVSPFTVYAGQTKASIPIQIIDDRQIDLDDTLTLTLSGVTGNAKLSETASEINHQFIITNNDVPAPNTLQVDLTWSTGVGQNIDLANLDLLLQRNVVYDSASNTITDVGDPLALSVDYEGFETLRSTTADKDQVLWLAVQYTEGTSAVDYTITLNGFGWTGDTFTGSFKASDANTSMFIGPFTKLGSTFTFGRNGKRDVMSVPVASTHH